MKKSVLLAVLLIPATMNAKSIKMTVVYHDKEEKTFRYSPVNGEKEVNIPTRLKDWDCKMHFAFDADDLSLAKMLCTTASATNKTATIAGAKFMVLCDRPAALVSSGYLSSGVTKIKDGKSVGEMSYKDFSFVMSCE